MSVRNSTFLSHFIVAHLNLTRKALEKHQHHRTNARDGYKESFFFGIFFWDF